MTISRNTKKPRKGQLPSKICPICQRPFEWRKKWARDWANVIYCSERCQREAKRGRATVKST